MRKLPRHVTVRLDPRTAADFHLHAFNRGTTVSELLRAAIREALTGRDPVPAQAHVRSRLAA